MKRCKVSSATKLFFNASRLYNGIAKERVIQEKENC
ncbi:hypothetical protein X798_03603 [Onchocerca flexuosa]|uniref:Uncharacterized protein n=1 Tax=Onchocerca flexuosa TaxID=387005 RepID=A0A238BVE3_9BILA|nr:hypothetical protein X798_03603 [Onchocerca flexuosa]